MIQRRILLLSIVLTLFLALSAIAIRSYFVETSPAAGESIQVATAMTRTWYLPFFGRYRRSRWRVAATARYAMPA